MSLNNVGEKFQLTQLIKAQNITKEVVRNIALKVQVGMNELDGIELINNEFKKYGNIKFWHPHKFRIGKNTLCSFKEESEPQMRVSNNDIFFIDVGPILFEHEGDYGETFVMGVAPNLTELKNKSKMLFDIAKIAFLEQAFTGQQLYHFLEKSALNFGVELNMKTLGHRIGDFPHHLFYRGKMADVEQVILPNLWVLEVQIKNKENTFGAFFEDILFS